MNILIAILFLEKLLEIAAVLYKQCVLKRHYQGIQDVLHWRCFVFSRIRRLR